MLKKIFLLLLLMSSHLLSMETKTGTGAPQARELPPPPLPPRDRELPPPPLPPRNARPLPPTPLKQKLGILKTNLKSLKDRLNSLQTKLTELKGRLAPRAQSMAKPGSSFQKQIEEFEFKHKKESKPVTKKPEKKQEPKGLHEALIKKIEERRKAITEKEEKEEEEEEETGEWEN